MTDDQIVDDIDRNATPEQKVEALKGLALENKPIIDTVLKEVDAELGTFSKSSFKAPQVIKVDTSKMMDPKEWGFRFAAVDLKMPNGQLVEYYMPLKEVEAAKKDGNHALFEKWRNTTEEYRVDNKAEFFRDLSTSRQKYQAGFDAALTRNQLSPSAVAASWAKVEASLSSIGMNSSLSSSAEIDPTRQVPSTSLTADKSSPKTNILPSGARDAKYFGSVSGEVKPVSGVFMGIFFC